MIRGIEAPDHGTSPAEDRDAVCDELRELYLIQCARRGVPAARRWYRRQVATFVLKLTVLGSAVGLVGAVWTSQLLEGVIV